MTSDTVTSLNITATLKLEIILVVSLIYGLKKIKDLADSLLLYNQGTMDGFYLYRAQKTK